MKKIIKSMLPILFVLLLWSIGSQFTLPLFLPKPTKVFNSFIELLNNGMLLNGLLYSFVRITVAMLLSAAISIPLGVFIVNNKLVDNIISPITNFMRYMPVTAFYPLLMMWVGIDEKMKITFLFVATFFYFLPSVVLSLKSISIDLVDTALTIGMSKTKVLFKVVLPYSLPNILQTFLMMYGIGWTYVVVAEQVNANYGLGHIINVSSARGRTDMVFVSLIVILVFSFIFDTYFQNLIKKSFKWKFARELD